MDKTIKASAVIDAEGNLVRVIQDVSDIFDKWEMDKFGWRVVPVEITIKDELE